MIQIGETQVSRVTCEIWQTQLVDKPPGQCRPSTDLQQTDLDKYQEEGRWVVDKPYNWFSALASWPLFWPCLSVCVCVCVCLSVHRIAPLLVNRFWWNSGIMCMRSVASAAPHNRCAAPPSGGIMNQKLCFFPTMPTKKIQNFFASTDIAKNASRLSLYMFYAHYIRISAQSDQNCGRR